MKPYGIRFVGPVCAWGCCWKQNVHSGFDRRIGHGQRNKKRERGNAKREIRNELRGKRCAPSTS